MDVSRRQFLKLMGATTVSAVAFTGCIEPQRQFELASPAKIPEESATGTDSGYATVCRQCPASCGLVVRVVTGRAKKVEGNPEYPTNRGKHCALAEASLQALYHPDRPAGPLRRQGDRGSGRFTPVSWDDALGQLTDRLRQLAQSGQGDTILALTGPQGGHRALVLDRFLQALGGQRITYGSQEEAVVRAAVQRVFGQDRLPHFAIEDAQFIMSFGADFLGPWLAPVPYQRAYGQFRQGRDRRGYLVQIEPRFSMTAASADRWLPVRPGTEGMLALSMAQVIVEEGLGDAAATRAMTGRNGAAALAAFRPEAVADRTGIQAGRIRELARRFAQERPSLALGGGPAAGQTNGLFNLQAIYALNYLAGNVGPQGTVRFNPAPPLPDFPEAGPSAALTDWQALAQRLRSNQPRPVNLVLLYDANPVYGLPAGLGLAAALDAAPFIVSFSPFLDDTATHADLVLPDTVFFEAWGDAAPDPAPGFQTIGFQQPVVQPFTDARPFADVLLTLAGELGGAFQQALPWATSEALLRERAQQLQGLQRGSVPGGSSEDYWVKLLQQGGWWDTAAIAAGRLPPPPALPQQAVEPAFAGDPSAFPFALILYPAPSLHGGQGAHLPWLQALPDPTTTAVWQSWVELNPRTAEQLGVGTGDLLTVESPVGSLEAPVYVHPATPPEVVAMPLGWGHQGFTRYASGRGVNPLAIVAPLTDQDTGALALCATRVRLRRTGRSVPLATFEGAVPPIQLADAPLVPTVP